MTTSLYMRLLHRPVRLSERWSVGAFASIPFAPVCEEGTQGPQCVQREDTSRTDELPAADRLTLLLPAADVLLVLANVSLLALPKLRPALPNLVEERLVQDTQQCCIVLGLHLGDVPTHSWRASRKSQSRVLMIAGRAWARSILDTFASHKHRTRHLLPVQFCVSFETPAVVVTPHTESINAGECAEPSLDTTDAPAPTTEAPTAEVAVTVVPTTITLGMAPPSSLDVPVAIDTTVRTGRTKGYDLHMLPANVGDWLGITPTPITPMVSPALRELVPDLSTDPTAATLDWSTWAASARGALASGEADPCQSDFARGSVAGMDWSPWRLSTVLAVLLVVVQLIGMNVRWLTLRAERKRLDIAICAQLQTASPNMPVIPDPSVQTHHQVEQLRLAAGKSAPGDFLPLADRSAQVATGFTPNALFTLDYHGRALTVTLKDGIDTTSLCIAARNVDLNTDTVEVPRGIEATVPGSRWMVSIAQ